MGGPFVFPKLLVRAIIRIVDPVGVHEVESVSSALV
jgi:hypothetical protein